MTEVEDADAGWVTALLARDVAGAAGWLHEDYALVLVHPVPAHVDRAEWLRTLPDYVVSQWDVRGSQWDQHGDVAVHLQLIDMRAVVAGIERNGPFAITDTWLPTPAGWRVWRRHSTPLLAGGIPRPHAE
jgi:hypothetical protein